MLRGIRQLKRYLNQPENKKKSSSEVKFWRSELKNYVDWYNGLNFRGVPPPKEDQKIKQYSLLVNAATTWLKCFQEQKYLIDLELNSDSLKGMRILDVGCGPFPNLLAFSDCERHGIDPLIEQYKMIGYPIAMWARMGFTYHGFSAEDMPFPDHFFDGIISVNAIDHVDDFARVASEIKRVLKPNGLFRMHVHYHSSTVTEPIELTEQVFLEHYCWVSSLKKIYESRTKDCGFYKCPEDEIFVLWGNT